MPFGGTRRTLLRENLFPLCAPCSGAGLHPAPACLLSLPLTAPERDIRPDGFRLASPLEADPLSAEIKPSVPSPLRGAIADCKAREETLHEVETRGRRSSVHTQEAKPDPWMSWGGRLKGDHSISAPWDRLRHMQASSRSLSISLWAPAPATAETRTNPKAPRFRRPCWKAGCCEPWRGLPALLTEMQIFAF